MMHGHGQRAQGAAAWPWRLCVAEGQVKTGPAERDPRTARFRLASYSPGGGEQ